MPKKEYKVTGNVTIQDTKLIFRNLAGEKQKFNVAGARNFGALLPLEDAERMAEDGWPIKWLKKREDDEDSTETPWIKVKVNFDTGTPPRVILVTGRKKTTLTKDTVAVVDSAAIKSADLTISPYNWTDDEGEDHVTAYLQALYVNIEQDELSLKYADED